jgi:hypothetical protein
MTEYTPPPYTSTPMGPGSDAGEPVAGTMDVAKDQASDVTAGAVARPDLTSRGLRPSPRLPAR